MLAFKVFPQLTHTFLVMVYWTCQLGWLKGCDDFLMNVMATDPEVGEAFCRIILSVLLQKSIGKIKVVAQRMIHAVTPEHRGIRMDVEV